MISPKVTTLLGIGLPVDRRRDIYCEAGLNGGQTFEGEIGGRRELLGIEEFEANFVYLPSDGSGERVEVGDGDGTRGSAEGFEGLFETLEGEACIGIFETEGDLGAGEGDFGRLDGGGFMTVQVEIAFGKASGGFAGNGGAGGGALEDDDVDGGLRVTGGDDGLELGGIVKGTGEAGDAECLRAREDLIEFGEGGFGEGQGGFEGFGDRGFLTANKEDASGASFLAADGDGFEHDLRAFEGQAADLDDADGGKREVFFGEDFTDQGGDAAHVSGAGDEGTDLDDGGAGVGFQEGF